MRITGGRARGIILKLPSRGTLRPATGYLREAVFSALGEMVAGAKVLDMFAGTGAYGLEALSRGATHVVLVDANSAAVAASRANLAAVAKSMGVANSESLGRASEGDAFVWQPGMGEAFDLVFVNPPYALLPPFGVKLVERATAWVAHGENARLLLEAPGEYEPELPSGWRMTRRIGKGKRQPCSIIMARTT